MDGRCKLAGKENGDIQYSYNIDYEDGTGVHYYEMAEEIEKAI